MNSTSVMKKTRLSAFEISAMNSFMALAYNFLLSRALRARRLPRDGGRSGDRRPRDHKIGGAFEGVAQKDRDTIIAGDPFALH